MDIAGVAGKLARIEGRIKRLEDSDKEVVAFVLFALEVICAVSPGLREALRATASDEHDRLGPDRDIPSRTYAAAIADLCKRLNQ